MKLTTVFVLIIGVALLMAPVAATGRPIATATLAPIPNPYYDQMNALWGGNSSSFVTIPNFGMMLSVAWSVYTDKLGVIAWVIIISLPFIAMWIAGADLTLPAVAGILLSSYLFVKLPAEWLPVAVGGIVVTVAALLYSLYKRNY